MKFHFLTEQFYADYAECEQILIKDKRPYCFSVCEIDNILVAVPLRSNFNKYNRYVMRIPHTNGGLDFTKAVVISDENRNKYINSVTTPTIRHEDYRFFLGKEYVVMQKVKTFIKIYKKRYENNIDDNSLLEYCSLKYFHKELGLK